MVLMKVSRNWSEALSVRQTRAAPQVIIRGRLLVEVIKPIAKWTDRR